MIQSTAHRFIALFLVGIFALALPTAAFAQNDDIENLGIILNPDVDYGNDGKPLTAAIMANYYYNQCTSQESLAFTDEELDILCSCTAAGMSKVLTVDEFKTLSQDNRKGLDARGKALAFAYAPCMEYAIAPKVRGNCMQSRHLQDIVVGKRQICRCTVDSYQQLIKETAPKIVMEGIKYDPMTMNPLEHHFTTTNYLQTLNSSIKFCRFRDKYKRDNK